MSKSSPHIAIVGAGPAGLMAAEVAAAAGAHVTIYDQMASAGRKFLLAGRGGLNLTHSEDLQRFLARYGAAAPRLRAAIEGFPPSAVRSWCEALGQETFVGSSGRVFPKSFKTSPLLRPWLRRLDESGARLVLRHRWIGWDDQGALLFETTDGAVTVNADAAVLAMGGASWPRLGSDGRWSPVVTQSGIAVSPLRAANCGFVANWSSYFRDRFEGQPLKGITLAFEGETLRSEAVITREGLEGSGIYALSARLRETIEAKGEAILHIALRPDTPPLELQSILAAPRGKQSLSNVLRKTAKLSPAAIGLLNEAALASSTKLTALSPASLAALINAVPVRLVATAELATAISTAGGIRFDEIDDSFMLKQRPGVFVAGEMLDWEAPTGGYLLQASFSTGVAAGQGALKWLERGAPRP